MCDKRWLGTDGPGSHKGVGISGHREQPKSLFEEVESAIERMAEQLGGVSPLKDFGSS